MSNLLSETDSKLIDDKFEDSDSSDGEGDEEIDPEIAKLSTKQLMQRIYMKLNKIEDKKIPKLKKKIVDVEANQVAANSKMELLEDKNKDLENKIKETNERTDISEDLIKQTSHNMKKLDNEVKSITEIVDQKADKEVIENIEQKLKDQGTNQTNRMKELENRFRKDMDEKIKILEAEINKIGPKPPTLIQPAGILNLGPSSANENLSIQQEIQNAQRIPVPSEDKQTANYARILSTRREATQRTRLQVPKPAQPETVAPIITYSKEDIIKEAASNIGITKVSDMTIRKFSNLKNKMRYSKEYVWNVS